MTEAERKVAAFIGAYEALCLEHGLCVVMVEESREGEKFQRFAVGVLTNDKATDTVLAQSCEEMRLGGIKLLDGEPA